MNSEEKLKITYVVLEKLREHPDNPNEHTKAQIKRLVTLIEANGFCVPIIVSEESDYITSGHGRLLAAKKMNMQTVPVIYKKFKDYDHEYSFLVSDNAINQWSDLNLPKIENALPKLKINFNIDLLGLKPKHEKPEPTHKMETGFDVEQVQFLVTVDPKHKASMSEVLSKVEFPIEYETQHIR